MRIVAGQYGGRRLIVPKGRDIRPTSDKVRGAIFNSLQNIMDFDKVRVLDAFCGTGALGLEALSRGAQHCTFIDKAKASLDLAKQNSRALDAESYVGFKLGDASKVQFGDDSLFDLVFLDPPYEQGLIDEVLVHLTRCLNGRCVLNDSAIVVCESEKTYDYQGDGLELLKCKVYGDSKVTTLRYRKSVA